MRGAGCDGDYGERVGVVVLAVDLCIVRLCEYTQGGTLGEGPKFGLWARVLRADIGFRITGLRSYGISSRV